MPASAPAIKLGESQITGKGQKSIPIWQADGKPFYLLPNAMDIPFNATAFQNTEATRVNLCYNPDDDVIEQINAIEAEVKKQLIPHLQEMFGAQAVILQKHDNFQSALKTNKGYQTLKTKINLIGKYQTRVWNPSKESMPMPSDWSQFQAKPRLWVRSVWIFGKEAGITFDTTDCILQKQERSCPF